MCTMKRFIWILIWHGSKQCKVSSLGSKWIMHIKFPLFPKFSLPNSLTFLRPFNAWLKTATNASSQNHTKLCNFALSTMRNLQNSVIFPNFYQFPWFFLIMPKGEPAGCSTSLCKTQRQKNVLTRFNSPAISGNRPKHILTQIVEEMTGSVIISNNINYK